MANILCPSEGVRLNCSPLKSPHPLGFLSIDTFLFFEHSPSMLSDLPCSISAGCPWGEAHMQQTSFGCGEHRNSVNTGRATPAALCQPSRRQDSHQSHQAVFYTKSFKELPCPRALQAARAPCEECGGNGSADLSDALLSLQAGQDLRLFRGAPKS